MLKLPIGAVIASCILLTIAAILFGVYAAGAPTPPCTEDKIQAHIIATERPAMGQLEREFWQRAIAKAADAYQIPRAVMTAKIARESSFHANAINAESGAKGAGQLMPMHVKGFDPYEIEANLNKSAEVLAGMLKERNGDIYRALRYYNGGTTAETGAKKAATAAYADAILARVYLSRESACAVH